MIPAFTQVLKAIGATDDAQMFIRGKPVIKYNWNDKTLTRPIADWVQRLFKLASTDATKKPDMEPYLFYLGDQISLFNKGMLRKFLHDMFILIDKREMEDFIRITNKGIKVWLPILSRVNAAVKEWAVLSYSYYGASIQSLDFVAKLPVEHKFQVMVKELHPRKLRILHPWGVEQLHAQRTRDTEGLLRFDEQDPIAGHRFFLPGDSAPGTGIKIEAGHHRLYELYKRYINGLLDDLVIEGRRGGEILITFVERDSEKY